MIAVLRPLRAVLLALVCFAVFVAAIGVFFVMTVTRGFTGDAKLPADCALVFGAAVHGNDDPGPGIARRVDTAADLYKKHHVKTLILSGGKGSAGQDSEAEVMRRVALHDGVLQSDILLENHSTSTAENIRLSKPLAGGCSSTVAVSDRYHLARIRYLARHLSWPELRTFPAYRHANTSFEVGSVLRESAALIYEVWSTMTGKPL